MTKSELRKYAKDNGLTLAEAREKLRIEAAAKAPKANVINLNNVEDAAEYMHSLTDSQLDAVLQNGTGESGLGNDNLQIAINWARAQATPSSPPMYSDKFFSFTDNQDDRWFLIQILNRLGILLFNFTTNGAILIHKDNPKLNVATDNTQIVAVYLDGENVTVLSGLTGQKIDIAA